MKPALELMLIFQRTTRMGDFGALHEWSNGREAEKHTNGFNSAQLVVVKCGKHLRGTDVLARNKDTFSSINSPHSLFCQ